MKTMLTTVALTGILMLTLTAGASAEIIWSGEEDPGTVAGYTFARAGNEGCFTWDDPCTGIMHQDTVGKTAAQWYQTPAGEAGEMTRAGGWFVQTRVDVLQSTGAGGVCVYAGDELGFVALDLTPTHISFLLGSGTGTYEHTTTGYHTIRVEMLPEGTTYDVYVDNDLVLQGTGYDYSQSYVLFADGTDTAGGVANWDYLHVNAIPEPGTLVLLAGAFLMSLLVWRRR